MLRWLFEAMAIAVLTMIFYFILKQRWLSIEHFVAGGIAVCLVRTIMMEIRKEESE